MRPNVSTIYAPVVWVQSDWMPKNARAARGYSWAVDAWICSRARRLLRSPFRRWKRSDVRQATVLQGAGFDAISGPHQTGK
jgi:hypothetical protein